MFSDFFSDASGFSVKKDTTILHCLFMKIDVCRDFPDFPLEGHGFTRPRYQGWGSQKRMSTVLAAMEELPKRVRMPSTVQGEVG